MSSKDNIAVIKKPGRPSKFKVEYSQMLVDYFSGDKTRQVLKRETIKANGDVIREYETIGNDIPTFEEFAWKLGVSVDSLMHWLHKGENGGIYREFAESYIYAKHLQKYWLINNALNGSYNAIFAMFAAKNITDMRDVQTFGGIDGNALSITFKRDTPAQIIDAIQPGINGLLKSDYKGQKRK